MDNDKRIELIRQVGEEIIEDDELVQLVNSGERLVAYDGFEPSGNVHIAQGVLRAINVNKMTKAGAKFKMLVADWHAWANNKMGGDLKKIQTVGKYLIEVWRATGMDLDNVEFVWASDFARDDEYWKKVMQIAINTTIKRVIRCGQIMGRKENEVMQSSQILYPCMQCADIFYLNANICQLGMDQRKVNMLAREVGPKLGWGKPVVVSHHMLMGLGKPATTTGDAIDRVIDLKMSKSKPDTAIFMSDSEEDIKKKIMKAYCPEKEVSENPVLEYCKYLVFEKVDKMKVERPAKFGGDLEFNNYGELAEAFGKGELHPADLKSSVAAYINEFVEPVRKHFEKNQKARELLDAIRGYKVTR